MQSPAKPRTDDTLDLHAFTRYVRGPARQAGTRTIGYQNDLSSVQFPTMRKLNRPLQATPIPKMAPHTVKLAALGGHENNHTYPFA